MATQTEWPTSEMASQTECLTAEVATQAEPATAEAATQAGRVTAEAGIQAIWGTAEAGIQAVRGTVEAETQAVWATSEAGIQAERETAEVDIQVDWIEATTIGLQQSTQAHVARGQLVLFEPPTGTVQGMCQMMGFEFSEVFRQGVMWVEVKLRCEEWREGPYLRRYWYLTNTCYQQTAEGIVGPYANGELVTFVERYCGGITGLYSHMQTQMTTVMEIGGLLHAETTTTCRGLSMDAAGMWTRLETTRTLLMPLDLFMPPPDATDDSAGLLEIDWYPAPDDAATADDDAAADDDDSAPDDDAAAADDDDDAAADDDTAPDDDADDDSAPDDDDAADDDDADDDDSAPDDDDAADDDSAPDDAAAPADDDSAPDDDAAAADDSASATPADDDSTPDDDSAPADDSAAGPNAVAPLASQVPSVFYLFQSTGLEDFHLRLGGLREACTVLLAQPETANYIAVTGSMLLKNMAALNGKDAGATQQAFDALVAFAQTQTLTATTELLEVGVHQFNLLDVVFELLLLRDLGVVVQLVPRVQGGFLDHLAAVVQSFLPSEAWPPQAAQCWQLLQSTAVFFVVEILSLDVSAYHQPQHLAQRVFSCLECRIDQLLSVMPSG
ncbi:uncharacterized protein LOC134456641 [Engraulis encrasicolus]|uniref:uncharacterized protein LOC134456641 n=1 Tax=Engraulis encrasicolus TaxID=184585 RepID=UPI002FD5585F